MREVVNAITALGLTPNAEQLDQLAQGLRAKMGSADVHSHVIDDVTGLAAALSGKAASNHTHPAGDYAAGNHTHAYGTEAAAGFMSLATAAQIKAGQGNGAVTASSLGQRAGSESLAGLLALATVAITKAGTDTSKAIHSAGALALIQDYMSKYSGGFVPGMFGLFLHRKANLPAGWYYPSGEYVAQTSVIGAALIALPAQVKTDWGIIVSGSTIRLCDNARFFNGSLGRFPRFADGSTRQPGSVEADATRKITGTHSGLQYPGYATGAFTNIRYMGRKAPQADDLGSAIDFDSGLVVPTAAENRPYNVALTPAIYLGV